MAFTFYKAQGKEIGGSLVEDDRVEMAKELLAKAGDKLVLPIDTVVTDAFDFDARKVGTLKTVAWDEIGPKDIGVDIGEGTRAKFAEIVKGAKTVVWNGPMGVFEIPDTAKGTLAIAQALADATAHGAITVVGGGDSVAAIEKNGLADKVDPRLDRRRRLARVPRGQGAARRHVPEREVMRGAARAAPVRRRPSSGGFLVAAGPAALFGMRTSAPAYEEQSPCDAS